MRIAAKCTACGNAYVIGELHNCPTWSASIEARVRKEERERCVKVVEARALPKRNVDPFVLVEAIVHDLEGMKDP